MTQATFNLQGHNPDVLSCIANLSNDEVFTPPELVNQMLNDLQQSWAISNSGEIIWENKDVTFLDPCTKSGVFLREIVVRFSQGLAKEIPDLTERINHILTKQVFGIGITELTSLLSRRSLYCSKNANGIHSIARTFTTSAGNIWFERTEHIWKDGKCKFCNASMSEYERTIDLETYAYAFIHSENLRKKLEDMFGEDMQFDVIIGNPPYQLGSDGGTRDVPIYQKFVEQAKTLEPRFISMVIPARWMASGLGLSEFRKSMLADRSLRSLTDYPVAKEVFSSVEVKGGICYFLWERDYIGATSVTSIRDGKVLGPHQRDLSEFDVFVRDNQAVKILRKILAHKEESITKILSVDKEFGWTSNFAGFHNKQGKGDIPLHYGRQGKRLVGYINRLEINKSVQLVDKWKVMIPQAGSDGGQRLPDIVLGRPFVASSPSVCTQTYLFFSLDSEEDAISVESYLRTRFFRFLVSLRKITQHATRSTYVWVPTQDWSHTWTDAELYSKYDLGSEEIEFIESMIKTMEPKGE
jgi:site-specific DNA-methyltransferase (adenine-specific)